MPSNKIVAENLKLTKPAASHPGIRSLSLLGSLGGPAASRPRIRSLSLLGSLGALGALTKPAAKPSRDPFAKSAGFAGWAGRAPGRASHGPSRDPFAESAGFAGFAGRAWQASHKPSGIRSLSPLRSLSVLGRPAASRPGIRSLSLLGSLGALGLLGALSTLPASRELRSLSLLGSLGSLGGSVR